MKDTNKIVRTICSFTDNPTNDTKEQLDAVEQKLVVSGFAVQTKRVCSSVPNLSKLQETFSDKSVSLCIGAIGCNYIQKHLHDLFKQKEVFFHLDLTTETITKDHIQLLSDIIKNNPAITFNFAYVFNNPPSTPYFPSAYYVKQGFSIGLQPTDLAENCSSLDEWFVLLKATYEEIDDLFSQDEKFLGIDSSIAPFGNGKGSLIHFAKKLYLSFSDSVISDFYVRITQFIKKHNPKPVGLCGIMLPCLEDFELADEYEKGNFTIERNIFLSLHSGLGIDTYPIGVDEDPEKILSILKLVQALSNKYSKALSIRFVSDGKAKIGEKTDFQNQYLYDVVVQKL